MKRIFAWFLLAVTLPVSAQTVDINKLPAEKQAAIKALAAETPVEVTAVKAVDEVLSRVERFGEAAATGLVSFAKTLGVEANEFAKTPLGIIVVIGLIFHFAAGKIIGLLLVFFVIPFLCYKIYQQFKPRMIPSVIELQPVLWGLYHKRVAKKFEEREPHNTEGDVFLTIIMVIMTIVLMMVSGALL
jgi:hypothetical protein